MKKILYLAVPILAAGLVVPTAQLAKANGVVPKVVSSVVIEDTYDFGSEFTVPELEKEGVRFNSVVVFPDGVGYNSKKVRLNQVGTYEVRYTATIDGKYVDESYSFKVLNQFYNFSGDKSFATYGADASTFYKTGLHVSLVTGERINFLKPIDLTALGPKDAFIKAFVSPKVVGNQDFSSLFFVLTDVEDPTQTLKIEAKATPDGTKYPWTYYTACGPDQDPCGVEKNNIHISDPYGCPVEHSFSATYSVVEKRGKCNLNLNYRIEDNALYTNSGETQICKFDNSKHFANLWGGFPSGKVNISIYAANLSSDYASFVITDIPGFDLSSSVYEDTKAPEISVETGYEVLPEALVGYKYPVFPATAYDEISKYCAVEKSAYYVKDGQYYSLNIKDGYFDVKKAGQYKIVYESKDAVGNLAHTELTVVTKGSASPITVTPKSLIKDTWLKGVPYEFPAFRVTGGSGKYEDKFEVTYNGKPVPFENGQFIPKQVGNYLVKYTASDITTQSASYEYVLNVEYNGGVVFYDEPLLPKYFISGYEYEFPMLVGVDYGNNGRDIIADVDITYKDKTATIKSGTSYIPVVDANMGVITVTYKAKDTKIVKEIPTVLPVSDRTFAIEKYLIGDSFIYTSKTDRSTISSKVVGDSSFEFANPLAAEGLSVNFATLAGHSDYSALKLTLTDKFNTKQKVSIVLENLSNQMIYKVCNKTIKTDSKFGSDDVYKLSFSRGVAYFGRVGIPVVTYDDGTMFEGFDSQFVYITMTMVNAKTTSAFDIQKINNQSIASTTYDAMEPTIAVLDKYGGYQQIGTTSTTTRIIVCDVLDPKCVSAISVKSPSKTYVNDVHGQEIKNLPTGQRYTFTLNEYGRYSVNYVASDSIGNEATFTYAVGVLDDIAPEIIITSDYTTSCSVGENIVVPTVEAKDNYDKPENIALYISVSSPSGTIYIMDSTHNAVKATMKGIYIVTITAMDTAGNVTRLAYNVTVA